MKKVMIIGVAALLVLVALSAAIAQQKSDEKVVCAVTGETILKSQAKATYEYQGKTYYFCCEGCKEKFIKDPAKYIGKTPEAKDVYTCPMHPEVQSDKPGQCPKCGMNLEKKSMPMDHGQGQMPMTHGQGGMSMMKGQACPMMDMMNMAGTSVVVENTKDGVVVKMSSKDPATVKKLQDMGAKMSAMHKTK